MRLVKGVSTTRGLIQMWLERRKAFHNPLHERGGLFMQNIGIGLGMKQRFSGRFVEPFWQ